MQLMPPELVLLGTDQTQHLQHPPMLIRGDTLITLIIGTVGPVPIYKKIDLFYLYFLTCLPF